VQRDQVVFVDLRSHVQRDAGEKRLHRDGGETLELVPVDVVVVVMLVTKKSSVPTFSTAFWLFRVAMRGLDSTCTSPWVSRKLSSAAKLLVWKASPNRPPRLRGSVMRSAPGMLLRSGFEMVTAPVDGFVVIAVAPVARPRLVRGRCLAWLVRR